MADAHDKYALGNTYLQLFPYFKWLINNPPTKKNVKNARLIRGARKALEMLQLKVLMKLITTSKNKKVRILSYNLNFYFLKITI